MAAFRRLRGLDAMEDRTFRLLTTGWRDGTTDRYERAWVKFEEFLVAKGLSGHTITVRDGLAYLSHLFQLGFQWRTIGLRHLTDASQGPRRRRFRG